MSDFQSLSNVTWRNAGLTHPGLVREDNQDNYFISEDGRVYVVADGLGGSKGGAEASRLAVQTIDECWRYASGLPDDGIEQWMKETIAKADARIRSTAKKNKNLHNMGTTVVMIVIGKNGNVHIGHVGDSRALLIRTSSIEVLTTDHSVVMEMHLRGQLTLGQCRVNRYRHLITRCLGHDGVAKLDYRLLDPQPGDWFLLASDGLADVMEEEEIGQIVGESDDPYDVCSKLLAQVLERNAPDNTTIIAIACDPVPAVTM